MKKAMKPQNRKIKFKGAYNFRDLGGYTTSDRKKIHWGKLYRSDHLANLTKGDLKRLEELKIRSIIDLRSKEECVATPNRLPLNNGIKITNLEISSIIKNHNELKRRIFYGKVGALDLEAELFKAYEKAATAYGNEFRLFFKLLLDPANYPALVHCSAGKDRTGVVIALLLMALGVPKKTVVDDYMLSKVNLKPLMWRMVVKVRLLSLFRADIGQLKKLFNTQAVLLNSTFMAIDQNFGSIEAFFNTLGLDKDNRELLKKILCG